MPSKTFIDIPVIITVLIMLVIVFAIISFFLYKNYCNEECRINLYKSGLKDHPAQQQQQPQQTATTTSSAPNQVYTRDMRVLNDPLYPPLNRTDAQSFNAVQNAVAKNQLYVQTRPGANDQYRLVGYLVSEDQTTQDAGGNNWKLFARQTQSNRADFYVSPTNNNYDIKVPITDEITVGEKLRDVYTIPNEVKFNTPLLSKTAYKYIELPKTDLQSSQYM